MFGSYATNVHPDDQDSLEDLFMRDRVLGTTELVSRRLPGVTSTFKVGNADMSADGRFVVWDSGDPGFVVGDTNQEWDVFLWDRTTGLTERVSVGTGQLQGIGSCQFGSISDDGRYVVFASNVTNWVSNVPDNSVQLFVRDRQLQTTTLLSVRPDGQPTTGWCSKPAISGDGTVVAFQEALCDLIPAIIPAYGLQIYALELGSPEVEFISVAKTGGLVNTNCGDPRISTNGRYIAFDAYSNDLVAHDGNLFRDVFVRDRWTQVTTLVSLGDAGQFASGPLKECFGAAISGDGTTIAFTSGDGGLVQPATGFTRHVYVRECQPDTTTVYCAALPNSLGCTPIVNVSGTSSATVGSGHSVTGSKLVSGTLGILYYGTSGALAAPLMGFFQCVKPPIHRLPLQPTGGSGGTTSCAGSLAVDFNTWIAGGTDPNLVAGTPVYAQFWSRDPAAPTGMHFSPAVSFIIGP